MASCSKERTQKENSEIQNLALTQEAQRDSVYDVTKELRTLRSAIQENQALLRGVLPAVKTRSQPKEGRSVDTAAAVALAESLYDESYDLLQKLEITPEDIELVYGKDLKVEELSKVDAVGLALLFDMSFRTTKGLQTRSLSHDDFMYCLGTATGIIGAAKLINELSGKTISRGMIKGVLKLGLKSAGKFVNGVGLAIMAAEFAWCLYERSEVE